jgi:hypothetical protein
MTSQPFTTCVGASASGSFGHIPLDPRVAEALLVRRLLDPHHSVAGSAVGDLVTRPERLVKVPHPRPAI